MEAIPGVAQTSHITNTPSGPPLSLPLKAQEYIKNLKFNSRRLNPHVKSYHIQYNILCQIPPTYWKLFVWCLDIASTHGPSTRSIFFQSRHSYRPAEGCVDAKRRQRPVPPPSDQELLIGGAWWWSMGELRLGRSVMWSFCGWTNRQSTVCTVSPDEEVSGCRLEYFILCFAAERNELTHIHKQDIIHI
jgi:hypothetical protein